MDHASSAERLGVVLPYVTPVEDPVQLSVDGINSMIVSVENKPLAGGLIMLYKPGCRHCESVYEHGKPDRPLNALARDFHTRRLGMVCVANGHRYKSKLPMSMIRENMTFPAIFIVAGDGRLIPYTKSDRSKEALAMAINTVLRGTLDPPEMLMESRWDDKLNTYLDDIEYATGSKIRGDHAASAAPASEVSDPMHLRVHDPEEGKLFARRAIRKVISIDDGVDQSSERFVSELQARGVSARAVSVDIARKFLTKEIIESSHYMPNVIFIGEDESARALLAVSASFSARPEDSERIAVETIKTLRSV
jgi:hypothetical protein